MNELLNEGIMEEKKTKKMTKAEAFEYLKGKKVACNRLNNEAVQRKLFEIGIEWISGSTDVIKESCTVFLFIDLYGKITHCGGNRAYFYNHDYDEISADDILSIEIVEGKEVLSVDCALEHAKWIMKYLREECSPHTKMIIEGDHAELVEGVQSVVWKG